jgi:hypothetical protein
MTLEMPTLFALLGAALMAIAIFAPRRAVAGALAGGALQAPRPAESRGDMNELPEPWFPDAPIPRAAAPVPTWHLLVDPRAAACDAAARWELVDALGAVRAPWAEVILVRALDDESDPDVRNAVRAALAG